MLEGTHAYSPFKKTILIFTYIDNVKYMYWPYRMQSFHGMFRIYCPHFTTRSSNPQEVYLGNNVTCAVVYAFRDHMEREVEG